MDKNELVLEEKRRIYDRAHSALDVLDTKLLALLTAAGVLLALASLSVSSIVNTVSSQAPLCYLALLGLTGLTFIALQICIVVGMWPLTFAAVISNIPERLEEQFLRLETDEMAVLQMISQYVDAINEMSGLTFLKARWLRAAAILFAVTALEISALIVWAAIG